MVSRSYSNLLELASGEYPTFENMNRRIPRIMTVAGLISDVDDDPLESVCSDPSSSSVQRERIIIVANQLPIKAQRKQDGNNKNNWFFS
jgi:trehalose 6-phosphate synthase/phosphatase